MGTTQQLLVGGNMMRFRAGFTLRLLHYGMHARTLIQGFFSYTLSSAKTRT